MRAGNLRCECRRAPLPSRDVPPSPGVAGPPADKRRYVREMFSAIAPTYDLLNHLLSLNIDRSWRRPGAGAARLGGAAGRPVPRRLRRDARLRRRRWPARPGFRGTRGRRPTSPCRCSGWERPRPAGAILRAGVRRARSCRSRDGTFDGAIVGFGVRNLADLDAGLAELRRVLRDGRAARRPGLHHADVRAAARALPPLLPPRPAAGRAGWSRGHPTRVRLPAVVGAGVPGARRRCGSGWSGRASGTAAGVS